MAHVYCRQSDGRILSALEGRLHQVLPGQVEVPVAAIPRDLAAQRWDGATGLRAATAQETAQAVAEDLDAEAVNAVDGFKALRALALVVADLHSLTPAQMRALVVARYKGL